MTEEGASELPTLIQDILTVSHYVRARAVVGGLPYADDPGPTAAFDAVARVLAAQAAPGGLTAALLRQVAGKLESRMVNVLRAETERLIGDEREDGG